MELKSVFIDANIFIDANDNTRRSYEQSFKIIPYLLSHNIKILTSCDLITTIYYILSKKGRDEALDKIEQLNKICTIIDFSNKELLETTNLMREDKNFKDLEDTIQYVLAKNTNCDLVITNDKKFHSPDIELFSSDDFIKKFDV